MIPQLLTVRVRRPQRRTVRVWVPVLPVLLILSPLLVLAVAAGAAACLISRISLPAALSTGWRVLSALPGSRFDIEQRRTAVLVIIR